MLPVEVIIQAQPVRGGDLAGLLRPAGGQQELGGFRQEEVQQRHQNQSRDGAGDEHGMPPERLDEQDAQERGGDRTHVVTGHQGGGGGTGLGARAELGHHGDRGGQGATQSHAGEETPEREQGDIRSEGE